MNHFIDPDVVARKLLEIANAVDVFRDGRIYIERVNGLFLEAGGTPDQYRVALDRAVTLGLAVPAHPKLTPAGAEKLG